MASGADALRGGMVVFAITFVLFLSSCTVLELTSPDFFCTVAGQNGRYCGANLFLFAIAMFALIAFCVLSLLWAAFRRYSRLETKEED
ncbi:hypothetical protein HYU40_03585 [Candidatus Woesearchaeota archaeon]|nr:hypothetical protein [Candidatus Woesearchaeota archaeon]